MKISTNTAEVAQITNQLRSRGGEAQIQLSNSLSYSSSSAADDLEDAIKKMTKCLSLLQRNLFKEADNLTKIHYHLLKADKIAASGGE